MRIDRDSFLLLVSLIPAAIVLYCFVTWKTTGSWPAGVSAPALPSLPLPASMEQFVKISPAQQSMLDRARASWPIMVAGLGAGLILGIMAIGTLADVVRALGGFFFARPSQNQAGESEEAAEPATPSTP
jgi:hypothetical protein